MRKQRISIVEYYEPNSVKQCNDVCYCSVLYGMEASIVELIMKLVLAMGSYFIPLIYELYSLTKGGSTG